MRILVFGAGAIGSFLGGMLAGVCDVALVGRKPHVQAIRENGLIMEGLIRKTVKIEAHECIPSSAWDAVFITTKAYDTKQAIKEICESVNPCMIVSMQNGLSNLDVIRKHIEQYDGFTSSACITSCGVTMLENGKISVNGIGNTVIGSTGRSEAVELLCELMNDAGIACARSENIMQDIWIKGVVNSAINPLSAIFRVKNGELVANPHLRALLEAVAGESENVAKHCGFVEQDFDCVKKTIEVAKNTSENYSSMLQDVMKGKRTEVREINGYIVEMGEKHGIDVKLNRFLLNAVLGVAPS